MRTAKITRNTKETEINVEINLDSFTEPDISTGIGFFDHMLILLAKHSGFSLKLKAKGDINVDFHHTVEDIGICLGKVLKDALGEMKGINRYGFFTLPMEEVLCSVALDICNRPNFVYNVPQFISKIGEYDYELTKEFFKAFSINSGINLHINILYGENLHHITESIFKGIAHALKMAVKIERDGDGVLSTKGVL